MSKENKKARHINAQIIKSVEKPIKKADTTTAIEDDRHASSVWISPPTNQIGYQALVDNSTILPQCICAYKNNIAGFGLGVRYIDDNQEETPEMAAEYVRAEELLDLLSVDMDIKQQFENIIESKETYGIGYMEVVRDFEGNVTQVEFIRDTPTIRKSIRFDEPVEYIYYYKGKALKRKKRFCKYYQQKNGKTVYFKEFGDPRIMDLKTGEFLTSDSTIEANRQANEILEFTIGTEDYGKVRWIGQVLGIDGARKAENLNNRYFEEGRHTPLAIIVRGGTLSEDSFKKLQTYMNDIKGENGQHAFLVLEVEDSEDKAGFETDKKPDVELKDLASILQTDELFQGYLDNSRRKVQSAFRLPDLYVGYTTDFNRATAQTAMEVTEEQVFQPERESIEWVINNKLLNGYQFKYVEVYFKKPDISNPDDLVKILNIVERAGGLTPNKAKQIGLEAIGEVSEDYEGDWGNIPLAYQKTSSSATQPLTGEELQAKVGEVIMKAETNNEVELVAIMKEVRSLLERGEINV